MQKGLLKYANSVLASIFVFCTSVIFNPRSQLYLFSLLLHFVKLNWNRIIMAENDTFDPIDSEGEDDRDIQDCGAVYNEENYDDTISNLEEAIGAVHCLVQRTLAEV